MQNKTMRDIFIENLFQKMKKNSKIFFISADFGAPALDELRKHFKDRFINVGIAEQNLINIGSGLALTNKDVYCFAIAPFLTMRGYEQIRQNLAISSQINPTNINLIGVGAGLSYDVAGPSHHSFEDISIIRALPNIMFFSPSDAVLTKKFVDFSIKNKSPKYLRFDGKQLPIIHDKSKKLDFKKGFYELIKGKDICIVATGYMVHTALSVAQEAKIGVVDAFMLNPINEKQLSSLLKKYKYVISLEEGFINCGGLDALIQKIIIKNNLRLKFKNLGFDSKYVFELGNRDYLHKINKLDKDSILRIIDKTINEK